MATCTVRGDRGAVSALRGLVASLEAEGHTVLTKHLLDDHVESAEARLTERQVYERDIEWLEACDILIADASGSSFGEGAFRMTGNRTADPAQGGRVLLLYSSSRAHAVSRLIVGNAHPRCIVQKYENPEDLIFRVSQSLRPNA